MDRERDQRLQDMRRRNICVGLYDDESVFIPAVIGARAEAVPRVSQLMRAKTVKNSEGPESAMVRFLLGPVRTRRGVLKAAVRAASTI